MLLLRGTESKREAIQLLLDPILCKLIALRMAQLGEGEFAHFIVVQPGDLLEAVNAELGFSILENLVDGACYGNPDFTPSWEWIEDHGDWFELVFILTDDGFAHVLFVKDDDGIDPELLALCREYSAMQKAEIVSAEGNQGQGLTTP